jgi:hypothetical protein
LELDIKCVQQALNSAYENNCPHRPLKTGRRSLKWTLELDSLRRGGRRLFKSAEEIIIRIIGNCMERLSRDIGGSKKGF